MAGSLGQNSLAYNNPYSPYSNLYNYTGANNLANNSLATPYSNNLAYNTGYNTGDIFSSGINNNLLNYNSLLSSPYANYNQQQISPYSGYSPYNYSNNTSQNNLNYLFSSQGPFGLTTGTQYNPWQSQGYQPSSAYAYPTVGLLLSQTQFSGVNFLMGGVPGNTDLILEQANLQNRILAYLANPTAYGSQAISIPAQIEALFTATTNSTTENIKSGSGAKTAVNTSGTVTTMVGAIIQNRANPQNYDFGELLLFPFLQELQNILTTRADFFAQYPQAEAVVQEWVSSLEPLRKRIEASKSYRDSTQLAQQGTQLLTTMSQNLTQTMGGKKSGGNTPTG